MISAQQLNSELAKCDQSQGWPVVKKVYVNEDTAELILSVPKGLPTFGGHFPSHAVVPGILQIHWAAQLAELCFAQPKRTPLAERFEALKGIKFNAMVLPAAELSLSLKLNAAKLNFSYVSEQSKHSNGVLIYQGAETGEVA